MFKRTKLIIISLALLIILSSCSYFLPSDKKYIAPELRKSEVVVMPSSKVRTGDLLMFYDLESTFIPEPTLLYSGELEISGKVKSINFSLGQEVKKGDLVLELDTQAVMDKIMVQEINVEKNRLNHEYNLVLYENGKADKYTIQLSALTLEASLNYLSDLKEELSHHYLYAPMDGVVVSMKFGVGDNAAGKAFEISRIEDGIFEVKIRSNTSAGMTLPELALISLDIGKKLLVLYEGNEYEVEIVRDFSLYHMEIGYDPEFSHVHFKSSVIPPGIAFLRTATLRNIIDQAFGAVVVPVGAVYAVETNPYSYVIVGEDIEKRPLELGMTDGVFYEVLSGLEEGESILKIN